MKKKPFMHIWIFGILMIVLSEENSYGQIVDGIQYKVDSLMKMMTIEEKIGQLCQYSGNKLTGPANDRQNVLEKDIKAGKIGAVLNVYGVDEIRKVQRLALQSRLHIPLLFGLDVIHGFKTTFPIPLAQAASWNTDDIKESAHIAAEEASASGINWTFSPMVDIAQDPRWGRITEGPGEDPYLASRIATSMVIGYQGNKLEDTGSIMACAKHFAGYGAVTAGRDYNAVDMSLQQLWQTYLLPFKATADAGVATFMSAFNTLDGIPCTGNEYLLRDVLKKDWGFKGFIVSDWNSIGEMTSWGYTENLKEAAKKAIIAGCDMDMEAGAYQKYLDSLFINHEIDIELLDNAVRRILYKKFEMGLFDDPFRYCDNNRENKILSDNYHTEFARKMADESIVLLKNKSHILPMSFSGKKIALIGPLIKSKSDMLGSWAVNNDTSNVVDLYTSLKNKFGNTCQFSYAKGCDIMTSDQKDINDAITTAKSSDMILLAIGESASMTGEATSRSNIEIPQRQEELFDKLKHLGKPIIVLLMAGRPLIFNNIADSADAILYCWWLGSQAGNAIADVLSGSYNPSARLPVTFPRSMGQIPISYRQYNTGRPYKTGNKAYHSAYMDGPNDPEFVFGYGMSYSNFEYSNIQLNKTAFYNDDSLIVTCFIRNKSNVDGKETVQLYLRDEVASVVRPVKELKLFSQIYLKANEVRKVQFVIHAQDLGFYDKDLHFTKEPGYFQIMIGKSSNDIQLKQRFYWSSISTANKKNY